jgi:hypothetical protein
LRFRLFPQRLHLWRRKLFKETKMPDEKEVDGFSDSQGEKQGEQERRPAPPDPGAAPDAEAPLSPEEYAKEQREARQEE